ncbi:MAG TPA: hypothetical protein EYO33_09215 [Phycisphaerales bacterium]|nr:hypothetical protein [Phycisphaerales bacterium]
MSKMLQLISLPTEGLGWMRRGLGLWCAVDCLVRLPEAAFYLSDLGVLSRSQYFTTLKGTYGFSFYLVSGQPWVVYALLLLTIGLGLLQLMGRDRRPTRVLLWVLMLSLQNRNPALLDASDDLVRLLLFWDIFLPPSGAKSNKDVVTLATLGLQIQLTACLFFRGLSASAESFWLSVQWGTGQISPLYFGVLGFERLLVWLLIPAVWFRPIRIPMLVLAVPILAARATLLHPLFPMTLLLALVSLLYHPKREQNLEVLWPGSPPKKAAAMACLVGLATLTLALNISPGGAAKALGQGLGFHQDWSQVYPVPSDRLVQLAALDQSTGQMIWSISSESGRRDRLFANKVGQDEYWASTLSTTLALRYGQVQGPVTVWMRTVPLSKEFSLGGAKLKLLSDTPVHLRTEGNAL